METIGEPLEGIPHLIHPSHCRNVPFSFHRLPCHSRWKFRWIMLPVPLCIQRHDLSQMHSRKPKEAMVWYNLQLR